MPIVVQIVKEERDASSDSKGLEVVGIQPGYLPNRFGVADFRWSRFLRGLELDGFVFTGSRKTGLRGFFLNLLGSGCRLFYRFTSGTSAQKKYEEKQR
jgi:hypothetical protein